MLLMRVKFLVEGAFDVDVARLACILRDPGSPQISGWPITSNKHVIRRG